MERKHYLDNIRWVTVLLVLVYHVIYFYNAKGVPGGIGGFYETQPWDAVISVLYPWFMMLLFVVAGISARYALNSLSHKEFIKTRTRKLLVPATIGLFVFQWITGYFNTHMSGLDPLAEEPILSKYIYWAFTGIGPLWFVQNLWLFSLLLVLFRVIGKNKLYNALARSFQKDSLWPALLIVVLGFPILWAGAQCSIDLPEIVEDMDQETITAVVAGNIWNIHRPFAYFVPFLMGYYLFSHDSIQEKMARLSIPFLIVALALGTYNTIVMYGQNDIAPNVLRGWRCNLYAWFAILAMLSCFKTWFNKTNRFATYMTQSSFGIYVVHYVVIISLGYMMKFHTSLAPWMMYVILFFAVMLLSPAIYEIIRRIPFVRWCVLGIKKTEERSKKKEGTA